MAEQSIGGTTGGQTGNQVATDGLKSIESRAEARRVAEQKGDAQQWVQADLRDFARLREQWQQEHAGVVMAENARTEAAYKAALTKEAPDMAVRVQELDAANGAKVWAKEDCKRDEYVEFKRDQAEKAQRWTTEQAAALAVTHAKELRQTQDVTERHYAGEDMAVNARNSPAYRAALEAQAPDVAKELAERHKEALGSATAARVAANDASASRGDAANDAARGPALAIDAAMMERLQTVRTRDSQQAANALGLNGIEPASERRRQALNADELAEREGALRKANDAQRRPAERERMATDNKVESDEVFTASKPDTKAVIPPEVERQYRRDGSKYYELAKLEVVAFEDKGNKLETRSNSEQVAENLVRIAKARGWDEIKVSGSEAFRKEAWLEAAANGMHVKGYTPSEQDKEALAKRSPTEANRVENEGKPFRGRETEVVTEKVQETAAQTRARAFASDKQSDAIKAHPELVGAYVATAAVERKAEADGLTSEQRAVVASRVRQNVVNAIERGNVPEAQLNDRIEVRRDRDRQDEREVSR